MARRFSRRPSAEWRVIFLGFVMVLAFSALVARLWYEQVLCQTQWTKKIAGKSEVTVRIPAERGEIRDRNGITLVTNRASYEVDFYLPDMVRGYRQDYKNVPTREYDGVIKGMKKRLREADVVRIVNETVIPKLDELDLAQDYNSEQLIKHYRNDTLVPFTYQEELDFKTIAKYSEHDLGLPGVEIAVKPVRQYVYGALAAHLLGYVGAPQDVNLLPDITKYTFYQPDVDGKSQIEASMDKYLRGQPGTRILRKSVKGIIEGEDKMIPPKPGNNVYLTLDARVQTIVEQALRHPSLGRAAAVVIDPNNGDILGMGSVPSFDPNIFIPSITPEAWKGLADDEAVPLVSRAVSGFPPGSTFKIITALAGLQKGLGGNSYNCPGGITFGDHYFKCWIAEKRGAHGTLGLTDALKVSCDCYFYQYGNAATIESMDHIGKIMGIGEHYDLGLADEKSGTMPGPEWMRMKYPQLKWTTAHTANVTIGQGYTLASPLQMAMAYACVANGGVAYEPRLVRTVLTPDGLPALDENGQVAVPDQPKIRGDLRKELTKEQIDLVRQGLWKVVNEKGGPGGGGTGGKARLANIVVAGKTGTAQATDRGKKEHIAWFCCFAPFDKPRYAICTMVENGEHGGGVAAPIAARILEQCLAMDQGTYKPDLAFLTPARNPNPFAVIEALPDYKDALKVTVASEDEGTAPKTTTTTDSASIDLKSGKAKPDIRVSADTRGKVKGSTKNKPPSDTSASPPPPPEQKRGLFDSIFGRKPAPPPKTQSGPPLKPFNR